ncbi:thioesterase family protein [Maricaulaceae bacterium NA33B04]|nr:thioesterase family protein [Maricaulaceae bacterium NA33B04]
METLWRGIANAWECDELGHLNVRFYLAKASEAVASLARHLAMPDAFTESPYATMIAREITVRFLAEARPGTPLSIRGGVIDHDETSLTAALIMDHPALGIPAASFTVKLVHYAPAFGRTFPWSSRTRDALEGLTVQRPPECNTRSIDLSEREAKPTRARAQALGMEPIGQGMINAHEVDALGHIRAEFAFGKISDSVTHFEAAFPDHWQALREGKPLTTSGAVLEARIHMRRWPRAGQGFEVRSGVKSANDKIRALVHWVVDPVTGENLWSMEAVACLMDLEARKLKRATPDEVARLNSIAIEGLKA